MQSPTTIITIRRPRVVAALTALACILLFLHELGVYFTYELGHPFVKGFVPLFNLDTEGNAPTFFSSLLLVAASQLMYWISRAEEQAGSRYLKQWRLLSLIFLLLALDESAKIHELLIKPLRDAFDLRGAFYYSWVIVGMAGVSLLAALYFRFLMDLPSGFRGELLLAAGLYLTGVIVFELIGGNYASIHGETNLVYERLTTGEELLEISGLIILINALLKQIQTSQKSLLLSIQN